MLKLLNTLCTSNSYIKNYIVSVDPNDGKCEGPDHCLGVTTQAKCNEKEDWAGKGRGDWRGRMSSFRKLGTLGLLLAQPPPPSLARRDQEGADRP